MVTGRSGSWYRLPDNLGFADEHYVLTALQVFLQFSNYSSNASFADLSTLDQFTVLRMARNLKREMEQ